MSLSRLIIIWLLVLWGVFVFANDSATPHSEKVINEFLAALPGAWDGQAIETPVGPVDYSISFQEEDDGVVAGVAKLSVSNHHWRFWQEDNELRVRFLSTFRGNQEPTQLVADKVEDNTIYFHAPELVLLTLTMTVVEPNVDIQVFHHQKPHVHIRLTRSECIKQVR